jgi:hypothetical protein
MAEPMLRLAAAWGKRAGRGKLEMAVVHREGRSAPETTAIAPGVRAVGISHFVAGGSEARLANARATAKG